MCVSAVQHAAVPHVHQPPIRPCHCDAISDPFPCLQVFAGQQVVTFEYQGTNFLLTILSLLVLDKLQEQVPVSRGQLAPDTAWVFETQAGEVCQG